MPIRPPGTPDVDLTFDGSSGTINGGVFQTAGVQAAGTGVFNSFVRVQNTGTEQGYNTDAAAQFDEKASFHHSACSPTSRSSSATGRAARKKAWPIANSGWT